MANIETRIRFDRVIFKDSHEVDVVAIVTTKEALTIGELQIIAHYGSQSIREAENYEEMVTRIKMETLHMRHSSTAIKYGCLLNRLVGFTYYEVT